MVILVIRRGIYPASAYPVSSVGLASFRIMDMLVKGLAELGHDVYYQVELAQERLPKGVRGGRDAPRAVDITHRQPELAIRMADFQRPWVRTCHSDLAARGMDRSIAEENWIFVSRTLASLYGSARYVTNGIDPADFIFSETKENYFLFVACLDRALEKGLDIAIALARKAGFKLLVAGSAAKDSVIESIREMGAGADVELLGEIQGVRRAEIFAGAAALLFATQINESFGVVMAEALMSGTPVICSNRGACAEIISSDVGFVCAEEQDYLAAIAKVNAIKPSACRQKAMRDYHYLRMTRDYLKEYEHEIERTSAVECLRR